MAGQLWMLWAGAAAVFAKENDLEGDCEMTSKPSNPKDLIGTDKLPLGLVPASSIAYQSLGHLEGNLKYGLVNWREAGVRTSIYIDAALRHLMKFQNGEWEDQETKVPHLGSALACIGIIVDAYESGKLIDDRPKPAPISELIDRLSENVKHLRQLHADKDPVHYTISGPVQKESAWKDVATVTVASNIESEASVSGARSFTRSHEKEKPPVKGA